jgi:pimeloyl-ACP methyl ester carboxylesterase
LTVMRIRGADLAVERTGSGPTFLWGHGLMQSRANERSKPLWTIAEDTVAAGYEFIRYDARGHGESSGKRESAVYNWSELAEDALAIVAELGGEPLVLGGASMGAATMLHAAVRQPEVVRAMVLVIPPTAWETRAGQRAIYEGAASYVRSKGKEGYFEAVQRLPPLPIFADHPELGPLSPDVPEDLLPLVMEGAASSDFPPVESLQTLDVPTLVLAWESDPGHPVSTAMALEAVLPRATVRIAASVSEIREWGRITVEFLAAL